MPKAALLPDRELTLRGNRQTRAPHLITASEMHHGCGLRLQPAENKVGRVLRVDLGDLRWYQKRAGLVGIYVNLSWASS